MDKRSVESINNYRNHHMKEIKTLCEVFPTCEGCSKNLPHLGCEFRGKSPREWQLEECLNGRR